MPYVDEHIGSVAMNSALSCEKAMLNTCVALLNTCVVALLNTCVALLNTRVALLSLLHCLGSSCLEQSTSPV